MRTLLALVTTAAALGSTGTALAGGWATVGLAPLPGRVAAGETWRAEITVLRHGRTPTDGATPVLTIRRNGEAIEFPARPTGRTGVYAVEVVFPKAGSWRYEVDDGLASTGYGVSRTTTYTAVGVGSASTGSGFPVWSVPVALAGLAAAGFLGLALRRRRSSVRERASRVQAIG